MPSGYTAFSQSLYEVLEHKPPSSGLARQLVHLACHHENMPDLLEVRRVLRRQAAVPASGIRNVRRAIAGRQDLVTPEAIDAYRITEITRLKAVR